MGAVLGLSVPRIVADDHVEGGVAYPHVGLASRGNQLGGVALGELTADKGGVGGSQGGAVVGLALARTAEGQLGEVDEDGTRLFGDAEEVGHVVALGVVDDHRGQNGFGDTALEALALHHSLVGVALGGQGLEALQHACVVDILTRIGHRHIHGLEGQVVVNGRVGGAVAVRGPLCHVHGHPAEALHVDLHPCVGVPSRNYGLGVGMGLGQVAHGVAGGDAQGAVEESSGGGEMAGVALPILVQEGPHHVGLGIQRGVVGLGQGIVIAEVGRHPFNGLGGDGEIPHLGFYGREEDLLQIRPGVLVHGEVIFINKGSQLGLVGVGRRVLGIVVAGIQEILHGIGGASVSLDAGIPDLNGGERVEQTGVIGDGHGLQVRLDHQLVGGGAAGQLQVGSREVGGGGACVDEDGAIGSVCEALTRVVPEALELEEEAGVGVVRDGKDLTVQKGGGDTGGESELTVGGGQEVSPGGGLPIRLHGGFGTVSRAGGGVGACARLGGTLPCGEARDLHVAPAEALLVDLHPGVGVHALDGGGPSSRDVGHEAHGVAGGDAQGAVEQGCGGGEVAADALLVGPQEGQGHVGLAVQVLVIGQVIGGGILDVGGHLLDDIGIVLVKALLFDDEAKVFQGGFVHRQVAILHGAAVVLLVEGNGRARAR